MMVIFSYTQTTQPLHKLQYAFSGKKNPKGDAYNWSSIYIILPTLKPTPTPHTQPQLRLMDTHMPFQSYY